MTSQTSHVLVVDDDPKLPELLSDLLQDSHINLLFAANRDDAMRVLKDSHIDLVLLDIGLPGADGFSILKEIRGAPETQSIPVIMLTAWNSTEDKIRGFELGANDYLTKPFETPELRARVCAVLRSKRLQDELTRAN